MSLLSWQRRLIPSDDGRKAWLKDVAEKRGLGVAGKRGRKAWLKGVVLRHACRIGDVVLNSVGLPEQGTDNSSGLAREVSNGQRPHSEVACTPNYEASMMRGTYDCEMSSVVLE